jgi:hypothetical protein
MHCEGDLIPSNTIATYVSPAPGYFAHVCALVNGRLALVAISSWKET